MTFLKTSHDGYLMVDHRASPGIPEDHARRMGLDPNQVSEGKVMEAATLGCPHCGAHVVLNPFRTRERGHCMKCNQYICDGCAAAMSEPDYVHLPIKQISDLVATGKFRAIRLGSRPLIVPNTGD